MTDRDKFLQERMTGIGGSDASAVLGLSKYKTPFDVYREKRGEAPPQPDNEPMLWGRALEPVIRQEYSNRTGRAVSVPASMLRHPRHAFMVANIDGQTDDDRLLEVKTTRSPDGWGEPGTDEIPQHYTYQVQHYLAVTGLIVADVAVLIGGQDFRIYEVRGDSELQEMMIEEEAQFWQRVQVGDPPEPITYADAVARYGRSSRAASVQASVDDFRRIELLREMRDLKRQLDSDEENLKAEILKALGENDTLVTGNEILATWKATKPAVRFDAAALKADSPVIYANYLKTGEVTRRLLIK